MKVRSFLAHCIVRALTSTLRVRHVHPEHIENTPQYILAFWHRQLIPLLGTAHWRKPITVMSSQSKDGQFSTATLSWFGIESVSGSSTRGGSAAVRGILRVARAGKSIVFTPDGATVYVALSAKRRSVRFVTRAKIPMCDVTGSVVRKVQRS